jgi:hypothetical protein
VLDLTMLELGTWQAAFSSWGRHLFAASVNPRVVTAFIASAVPTRFRWLPRTRGPDGWSTKTVTRADGDGERDECGPYGRLFCLSLVASKQSKRKRLCYTDQQYCNQR